MLDVADVRGSLFSLLFVPRSHSLIVCEFSAPLALLSTPFRSLKSHLSFSLLFLPAVPLSRRFWAPTTDDEALRAALARIWQPIPLF